MTYGVCEFFNATETEYEMKSELVASLHMTKFLAPELQNALSVRGGNPNVDWEWYAKWTDSFRQTLLRAPKHGRFVDMDTRPYPYVHYVAKRGYIGKDRVELLMEGQDELGRPIAMTLHFHINVLRQRELDKIAYEADAYEKGVRKYCGGRRSWRIK